MSAQPNPYRARNTDELVEGAVRLQRRLSRALDALDGGDSTGTDDVAALARTLIGSGRGNLAIQRLISATGVQPESFVVSGKPVLSGEGRDILAFGCMPVVKGQGTLLHQPSSARTVTFREWTTQTALLVPSATKSSLSWSAFASAVANDTGSHLSLWVDDLMERSSMFSSTGTSLLQYLVRQLGWQLEKVFADYLIQLGQDVPVPTRTIELTGIVLSWASFWTKRDNSFSVHLDVSVKDMAYPVDVVAFDHDGQHVEITMPALNTFNIELTPITPAA